MQSLPDVLRALCKLALAGIWLLLALLTTLWGYGIYKSIGRVQTESDAGEFLTPNDADMYPVFFVMCGFLLFLVTLAFRALRRPKLSQG
ncbi:MAG: hypothetical protein EOO62_32970 [Hymenobacter sp.]|nr:MAG: hypothetical protein EOO62_32970 [Hymenobacter sp.]